MAQNKNLKTIKWQLSFEPKKWSYLEEEFDQIVTKVVGVQKKIKNVALMSPSALNLVDLFQIHDRECEKLYEDLEPQETCLICFDSLFEKTSILNYVSQ